MAGSLRLGRDGAVCADDPAGHRAPMAEQIGPGIAPSRQAMTARKGVQVSLRSSLRRLPALGAVAVSIALFALVPAAGAHVPSPTVTAQHAFIGDPLFGLDTPDGSLFGILPDERTAMASTTKLMTLDVTLHAVEDGVVGLNDQVTVDAYAASLEPP